MIDQLNPSWLDRAAYPFQSHFAELPAGRMHYVDTGEPAGGSAGPPIVFVHGTPTWSFEYRHLIADLQQRYRCIAPDHLGFGLSERPEGFAYTPEAHAEALRAFVRSLGLRRFTLVVHDYGGPIGLPLAHDTGFDVERIVLLNTWMWSFADDPAMTKNARIASSFLGRWLYRWLNFSLRVLAPSVYGDRRKLTKAIHRQYLSVFPDRSSRERVLWALARALEGSADHYDRLWQARAGLARIPALIVWGMKDGAFRPTMLSKWVEALPDARVVQVAGAGHWPHEEEPAIVLEAMRGFLSESQRESRARGVRGGEDQLLGREPSSAA